MADPTTAEMNTFVRVVDEFMRNYNKLLSPAMQQSVYNSGDPDLIADYENAINQGGRLKGTISATVGAWNTAKQAYAEVTSQTSMAIGDAIDEIRSWFGYKPAGDLSGFGSLGIIQLPAAAWVAGIVSAAYVVNSMISKIFVRIEASRLERTGMSRAQAITIASGAMSPSLFKGANVALLVGGALAIWLLMNR